MIKNYLFLPVLLLAIIIYAITSYISAQTTQSYLFTSEYITDSNSTDSVKVFMKTINCNNSQDNQQVTVIKIQNGDTLIQKGIDNMNFKTLSNKYDSLVNVEAFISKDMQACDSAQNIVLSMLFTDENRSDVFFKDFIKDSVSSHSYYTLGDLDSLRKQIIVADANNMDINIEKIIADSIGSNDIQIIKNIKHNCAFETKQISFSKLSDKEIKLLELNGVKSSAKKADFDFFKLIPNSLESSLNIQFKLKENAPVKIQIYNNSGHRLYIEEIKELQNLYDQTISLKGYNEGEYYLQVMIGNRSILKKITLD